MKITFDPFCTPLRFSSETAAVFYSSHITPMHSHNALQIIIDLKGSFLFRTERDEWRRYEALIINDNVYHQLNTDHSLQLIIYIDPYSTVGQELKNKYLSNVDFQNFKIQFSPLEEILLQKNLIEAEKKSIQLLVQLVLNRMADNSSERFSKRITHTLTLIKNTNPADLSIEHLASKAFISSSRLRMQFKQELNISLHQYILKHKLLSAIIGIVNGASIQDAAYRCGFNDTSHLNKIMIKTFSLNPSMFLKANKTFLISREDDSFNFKTVVARN